MVASTTGSTHFAPVQVPSPQCFPHAPQLDGSSTMSAQTPLQHSGMGAEQGMPASTDVPQAPPVHVATWHASGGGQSAGVAHASTQAPLPSHTWPLPHGPPTAAGTAAQQPAEQTATVHGPDGGGQSLA
jgi:hypothetical protein